MLAEGHICFSRRLKQKTKQRVTMGWGGGGCIGSTVICKDGALFCFCTVQIMSIEGHLEINRKFSCFIAHLFLQKVQLSFFLSSKAFQNLLLPNLFPLQSTCVNPCFFAYFLSTCLGSLFAQNLYCINCNLHVKRHSP